MADTQYTPLDHQISDAELEQLPPSALRLTIRKLLDHVARQDQRIRELEAEVSRHKARLEQNSSNSNKPPHPIRPARTTRPNPSRRNPVAARATRGIARSLSLPPEPS